jgi:hypothetical protein
MTPSDGGASAEASIPNGAFPTTHWSMIVHAGGSDTQARA